jgi:hypothetical protein
VAVKPRSLNNGGIIMKQIITKGGQVVCVTTAPYPAKTIKELKAAGYKVKEEK